LPLRLKKLRRQRDQTAASATEFVAQRAKDIEDLWEPWMREVDQLLEDAALVESVYDAQGKRHPMSRTRGRTQTPAEVALRLLILKHVRNWSYDTLE
jgi:transposase, IS5 family